jgi:hypothetical protein
LPHLGACFNLAVDLQTQQIFEHACALHCSGLAAAYRLGKEGADVTIFEAGDHAGGAIQSFSKDGFLWERGANTMASLCLKPPFFVA